MDLPVFVPRWMVCKMVDAAYREGKREQFQEDSAAIDRVFKKELADHGQSLPSKFDIAARPARIRPDRHNLVTHIHPEAYPPRIPTAVITTGGDEAPW